MTSIVGVVQDEQEKSFGRRQGKYEDFATTSPFTFDLPCSW